MAHTKRHDYQAKTKQYRKAGYDIRNRFQKKRNDGKGSGFVGCSCWHCRYGMHEHHTDEVRMKIRSDRRKIKMRLNNGDFDIVGKFSVGYTD